LRETVTDAEVKRLFKRGPIGSVDQFSDSVDLQCDVSWQAAVAALHDDGQGAKP